MKLRWQGWLAVACALALFLVSPGIAGEDASFLSPQGPVAAAQRAHLVNVTLLTMIAVLPVLIGVPLILWRYRYRNTRARFAPDWEYSGILDAAMWGVPILIVTALSVQLWHSVRALDPYRPIEADSAQFRIQVVGLDWKWLFIYPDLGIATVGEMAFPADEPAALAITSDTVMQSFSIAALAGQIYAMPGMVTALHVEADSAGRYEGENMQFNGAGFAGQKFTALSLERDAFAAWVLRVRETGIALSDDSYRVLAQRSTGAQAHSALATAAMPDGAVYFASFPADLFSQILGRYRSGQPVLPAQQPGSPAFAPVAPRTAPGATE